MEVSLKRDSLIVPGSHQRSLQALPPRADENTLASLEGGNHHALA